MNRTRLYRRACAPSLVVPLRLRRQFDPDRRGECQGQMGRRPDQLSAPRRPHPQSGRDRARRRRAGAQRAARGDRGAGQRDPDHGHRRPAHRSRGDGRFAEAQSRLTARPLQRLQEAYPELQTNAEFPRRCSRSSRAPRTGSPSRGATITRRSRPIIRRSAPSPSVIGARIIYGAEPMVPFQARRRRRARADGRLRQRPVSRRAAQRLQAAALLLAGCGAASLPRRRRRSAQPPVDAAGFRRSPAGSSTRPTCCRRARKRPDRATRRRSSGGRPTSSSSSPCPRSAASTIEDYRRATRQSLGHRPGGQGQWRAADRRADRAQGADRGRLRARGDPHQRARAADHRREHAVRASARATGAKASRPGRSAIVATLDRARAASRGGDGA